MKLSLTNLAQDVIALQHFYTSKWHDEPEVAFPEGELESLITNQHRQNFDLWHEEDKAREPDAADAQIAQVKRNIDVLNQRRNDIITDIDVWLAENSLAKYHDQTQPWNSETLGSIIDRLSIASLKLYHMVEQTERNDAEPEHIQSCQQKASRLQEQRQDLATALQLFVDDIIAGRKQNRLYRQFKMYNDPSLNPKIYNKK